MQQRSIFYTLEQVLSADLLGAQVYSLIGDANSLQAVLGSTPSVISNLILSPTSPSSLTLDLTNGFIATLATVDSSSYGSLSANTQQVLQLGYNIQTNVVVNNTLEAGQAQYVLIEAGFEQQDSDPQVLPYVNLSNPSVPYNGPGNTGIAQDTIRNEVAVITVKYGTPATSGSEVPPVVDSGNVAVAYVDLEAGQTTITAGQILDPSAVLTETGHGSPTQVLAGLLNAHHSGAIGQAPKIELNLGAEVQGMLPMANLLASNIIGGVTAFRTGSGNPNGVLAGNANRNGVCDTYYDVTNNAYYMCTTTGTSSTAVWTSTNLPASHAFNFKLLTTSGSYTPSSGTKYVGVVICGAGGGGVGAYGGIDQGWSGGGGGGASTAFTILPTNGLTFPATVTIGIGGVAGNGGTNATAGSNSQFSTPEIGTSLTGYGGEGGYFLGSGARGGTGGYGGGILQSASLFGTISIDAVVYPFINIFGSAGQAGNAGNPDVPGDSAGANGGSSALGGGGAGGAEATGTYPAYSQIGPTSGGFGGGGGAAGFNNGTVGSAGHGANGSNGAILVLEFVGN